MKRPRARTAGLAALSLLVGCGGMNVLEDSGVAPVPTAGDGGLPGQRGATAGRFTTHDRCTMCHSAAPGVLTDATGRNVAPETLWRGSMMAVAGRDPYWLAAFEHELAAIPAARATIERTCTRCHTPAGAVAADDAEQPFGFDTITRGTDAVADLAREGVTCTACHQITAAGLGTAASFTGGYALDTARRIYGPHAAPFAGPMQNAVNYTPTHGPHMTTSAHVRDVSHGHHPRPRRAGGNAVGPAFPEQVPYLEWRNSAFRDEAPAGPEAVTCQGCHMPTRDANGAVIATRLSNRPRNLSPRSPIGQHTFAGANAYMLGLLADEAAWVGAASTPAELRAGAAEAQATLRRAAALRLEGIARTDAGLHFDVRIDNQAGHRFPTGYPTRRAWLHVVVRDTAGMVRFESGATDAQGRLVARDGRVLESETLRPHLDTLTREDDVAVYEAVLGDAMGRATHVLLHATQYLKDNRLMPRGWSATHPDAAMTAPVGTQGDADFVAGGDTVHVRIAPAGWTPGRVEVTLRFQSIPPAAAAATGGGTYGAHFRAVTAAHPPLPESVATAQAAVP
jgi:hypothetical protein